MGKKGGFKRFVQGVSTTASLYGAVMGPMGGTSHKASDATAGYGRNVSSYSTNAERRRRGNTARSGTTDRGNRTRGNNRRYN